ncbi:MAG: hypothetical protein SFT92_03190 [Rickettsiales bacterium]|nr:hypothetical protein [Rickettsiales bacterium]
MGLGDWFKKKPKELTPEEKENLRIQQELQKQLNREGKGQRPKADPAMSVGMQVNAGTVREHVGPSGKEQMAAEVAEKRAEREQRQQLRGSGMKPHEVANKIAKDKLAASHKGDKSWEHFHGGAGDKSKGGGGGIDF